MNLETAKQLVTEKDYIVFKDVDVAICQFKSLSKSNLYFTYNCKPWTAHYSKCQTLGEYRGSFDSSVFPPRTFNYGIEQNHSVNVCLLIGKRIFGGYYSYTTKEWVCNYINDDNEIDYQGFRLPIAFQWCFKPDYLGK